MPLTVPSILAAWQFWATGVLIYAIVSKLVKATNILKPGLLCHPLASAFVTMQPFAWGLLFAIVPDFLPGHRYFERAVLGLAAGTLSHVIYAGVEKTIRGFIASKGKAEGDGAP